MPRARQRASLESIREALAELERLGMVAKTGEMRNGRPVFVVTKFSKKLREQYPNEEDFWAAVYALERQKRI
jgi:DNA-binding FadR family transcriptional regulator